MYYVTIPRTVDHASANRQEPKPPVSGDHSQKNGAPGAKPRNHKRGSAFFFEAGGNSNRGESGILVAVVGVGVGVNRRDYFQEVGCTPCRWHNGAFARWGFCLGGYAAEDWPMGGNEP